MTEHSCHHEKAEPNNAPHHQSSSCHPTKGRLDFLLWGSLLFVAFNKFCEIKETANPSQRG